MPALSTKVWKLEASINLSPVANIMSEMWSGDFYWEERYEGFRVACYCCRCVIFPSEHRCLRVGWWKIYKFSTNFPIGHSKYPNQYCTMFPRTSKYVVNLIQTKTDVKLKKGSIEHLRRCFPRIWHMKWCIWLSMSWIGGRHYSDSVLLRRGFGSSFCGPLFLLQLSSLGFGHLRLRFDNSLLIIHCCKRMKSNMVRENSKTSSQ